MMRIYSIKKDLSACVVKKCKGTSNKCSMCATPEVPSVALDCDLLVKSGLARKLDFTYDKINDCFLIEDDDVPRIGVIEFKGKRYNESHAFEQLMAGRQIAMKLASKYSSQKKLEVYLIIVARRHHSSSKKILIRKFRHAGIAESKILMAKCNDTFRDVRNRLRDG